MSANQNPPRRPRLSLQIKAISSGPNLRASRTIAAVVNPTSPTSFNTLSNVYATAIDRSTPVTAINTKQPLKLQTQNLSQPLKPAQTPYGAPVPFVSTLPDTPLTAQPLSPARASLQDVRFPSAMTSTPPLSAGPNDSSNENKVFSFHPNDTASSTLPTGPSSSSAPTSPAANTPVRRRVTASLCVSRPALSLPYVRNRSLHSILRNSPLPPPTAKTPISPRRQSARLADKASRRVCYESPIEHVITNDQYVLSHIDLLLDPSPQSASSPSSFSPSTAIDETMRDGGMTPGPFEEMRRRMAGLGTRGQPASPASSPTGIRKRRRKERSRRWVWTIGTQDGDEDEGEVGGAIAALQAAARTTQAGGASPVTTTTATATGTKPPPLPLVTGEPMRESHMEVVTPSIESFEETIGVASEDVLMYESEPDAETAGLVPDQRRALSLTPGDMEYEMVTPTVAGHSHLQPFFARSLRQDSEGMFNPETGSRRDTPVPADLVATE